MADSIDNILNNKILLSDSFEVWKNKLNLAISSINKAINDTNHAITQIPNDDLVVHIAKDETVTGTKTFQKNIVTANTAPGIVLPNTGTTKGTTPTTVSYWGVYALDKSANNDASHKIGALDISLSNNNEVKTSLTAYQAKSGSTKNAQISVSCRSDGTGYTYAPTPNDGAFDTQIATTKWVTSNAIRYGVCSTSGTIQAKTVTCKNFTLATGAVIYIKFSNTNTVTSATLNVNGTGAKPIISNGSPVLPNILQKNVVYCFVYDGTNWQLVTTINTASYNANGNTLLNSNFNNLILPGKYYVTTTRDTINAPISADASWWVEVSAYSDDSSVQILQEARMHSSSGSTTTSGPANVLVRCYDGTSWGTWTYSYSIFAG